MTVRQIANELNVSPSTVSLVLNNRPGVRKDLREQITKILLENNYTLKNPTNKNLKLLFVRFRSTDHLSEINDTFLASVMDNLDMICAEKGHSMFIINANTSNMKNVFDYALENSFDGILFACCEFSEYAEIPKSELPILFIDKKLRAHNVNTVDMDNAQGAYLSISHLKSLNHTEIGYFKSSLPLGSLPDRCQGFYAMMHKLALEIKPEYIVEVDLFLNSVVSEIDYYLKTSPKLPTCFVCDNDVIATGAIKAFTANGYRVPEDISIVGFNDSEVVHAVSPSLTSVNINTEYLARASLERMLQIIYDPTSAPVRISIPVTLSERESTTYAKK